MRPPRTFAEIVTETARRLRSGAFGFDGAVSALGVRSLGAGAELKRTHPKHHAQLGSYHVRHGGLIIASRVDVGALARELGTLGPGEQMPTDPEGST